MGDTGQGGAAGGEAPSGQDAATVAVAAHSLLQSVSVMVTAAEMVQTHGARLSSERRDELLALIVAQGQHVAGVLTDLARGVPPEVLEALDHLQMAAPRPRKG